VICAALLAGVAAAVSTVLGRSWHGFALAAAILVAMLVVERTIAGVRAARRFRDPAALGFPIFHLLRDLAWVVALAVFCGKALRRGSLKPPEERLRAGPGTP
jgi:hypothetical protein